MSIETEDFIIADTAWNYIESREITGSRMRPPLARGGLKFAVTTCKECTHTWTARDYGPGKLLPFIGGVIITCPSCGSEGKVSLRSLD